MSSRSQGLRLFTLAAAGLALAACSSSGTPKPDLAAVEPAITTQPVAPLPTGSSLKASDIAGALSERRFNFTSAGRKGTITYFRDGTFEYDETGKGTGTGVWTAADGKLCEARNPTSFLPKGTRSSCSPITSDGTRLTVGSTQLIPI